MVTTAERHRFQLIQCFHEIAHFKRTWLIQDLAEGSGQYLHDLANDKVLLADWTGSTYLQATIKLGIPGEKAQNKMICCWGM